MSDWEARIVELEIQAALQEDSALLGVQTGGQPVNHHFVDVLLDDLAAFVVRGQRVPVGHKVKALHLGLQSNPVFEGSVVVTQMQGPRGAHAGENTVFHGVISLKIQAD